MLRSAMAVLCPDDGQGYQSPAVARLSPPNARLGRLKDELDRRSAASLLVELFFGIDAKLLAAGEQHVEIVLPAMVVAVVGGISPADARAGFIDAAAVVRLQVLAFVENADVPLLFLDEHDDIFVNEVPA